MADFLTDEDIAKIDAQSSGPVYTDEDIARLDASSKGDDSGVSKLESAVRGYGQDGSLKMGDELGGAFGATLGAYDSLLRGKNNFGDEGRFEGLKNLLENYRRARDTERGANEAARNANPWTYGIAGAVGGAVPAIALTPSMSGLSVGQKILAAAQGGARFGAGAGFGGSNADLTTGNAQNAGEVAKDTFEGGVMGGMVGAGTEFGLQGLSAAKGALSESAAARANAARVDALGGRKLYNDRIVKADKVQAMGQMLKDEGVVGPFTSRKQIEANLDEVLEGTPGFKPGMENATEGYGPKIGRMVEEADVSGEHGIPTEELVKRAREEVLAPLLEDPFADRAAKAISDRLDRIEQQFGGQKLSASQLQKFKQSIQKEMKVFTRNADDSMTDAHRDLYRVFNDEAENIVDRASQNLPEGQAVDEFKQAKDSYGLAKQAREAVADRNVRDMTNRKGSLSDHIVGSTTAQIAKQSLPLPAKAALGVAGGAVNKFVRSYGNQMWASVNDVVSNILQTSPESLGRYATPLKDALERGPAHVAATDFVLSQRYPDYQKKKDELEQLNKE